MVRRRRTIIGRHPKLSILLIVLLLMTPIWVSLGSFMTNPANGPVSTRFAEWMRENGGGGIVTSVENFWYSHHQPPKGGKPKSGAIPAPTKSAIPAPTVGPPHLPPPTAMVPLATPPIAGEGQWHPIGRTVGGIPAMYAAYVRPDSTYTSEVTGVAWMDTTLLKASLYEGESIPGTGGPYVNNSPIPASAATSLVAAFNSGFLMGDAQGGYYADGHMAIPLVNGAASLVIYRNGTPTVGAWGTDVTMNPNVVAVRQNLDLIVDNGQPVPGLNQTDNSRWGNTLGGAFRVWRSGVGVTADGALVYVGGSGLSIVDLANVLQHAGAVRAMEMDINTSWVNFFSFAPPVGQPASGTNGTRLTADEVNSPSRYFSASARDFITMSARVP
ncbi:MAG TPA: phosphodiester glycosidase family protein [Acidimicrobiales bacterium]|nr:phosphodiester glycosidase family protein [Acidimicrobiales bacterium]